MKVKMISATEAERMAISVWKNKINELSDRIDAAIRKAANNGSRSTDLKIRNSDVSVAVSISHDMREMGYMVNIVEVQNSGYIIEVLW